MKKLCQFPASREKIENRKNNWILNLEVRKLGRKFVHVLLFERKLRGKNVYAKVTNSYFPKQILVFEFPP